MAERVDTRADGFGLRLIDALIFTAIPLGWIFGAFKTEPGHPNIFVAPFPGAPDDNGAAHMTIGLVLFVIVAARILYRAFDPPPALPGNMAVWEQLLARLTHALLFTVLIVMPVSGYIMSSGDKPPISFLGLVDFPKAPISPSQGKIAAIIHVLITQFVLYALIVLHLVGTGWHLFVRRDGALSRMLRVRPTNWIRARGDRRWSETASARGLKPPTGARRTAGDSCGLINERPWTLFRGRAIGVSFVDLERTGDRYCRASDQDGRTAADCRRFRRDADPLGFVARSFGRRDAMALR